MIHFFEGWGYPGRSTSAKLNTTANILRMQMPAGGTTGLYGTTTEHEAQNRAYCGSPSWISYHEVQSKTRYALGDALAIGMHLKLPVSQYSVPSYAYVAVGASSQSIATTLRATDNDANTNTIVGVRSSLPYLLITPSNFYLVKSGAAYAPKSATQSADILLAAIPTSGISMSEPHFYELYYDVVNSEIVIYVDTVVQSRVSYDMSALQNTEFAANIFTSYRPSYAQTTDHTSYGTFGAVYIADEVIGPVQVKSLPANADVAVDSAFGDGPHFSSMNSSILTTAGTGITTTTPATAVFDVLDVPADTPILGVSAIIRASSKHVSADRTISAVTPIVNVGSASIQETVTIPEEGYTDCDALMSDVNPITGQPWTVEDVNNLQVGASFSIVPRAV